jgi:TIR domain-containing protein/tetratricopeptide repeat protein
MIGSDQTWRALAVAATGKPKSTSYAAFISYAKADAKPAQEIADGLEARGFKCWIAPRDVRPGKSYGDEIIRGIESARCLILVLSAESNQSHFVAREVERAVSKTKPVFPIRIEEVVPAPSLEFFISSTQWIDAFSGRLDPHIDRLAQLVAEEEGREFAGSSRPRAAARRMSPWMLVGGAAAVLAVVLLGAVLLLRPGEDPRFDYQACLNLSGDTALAACDRAIDSRAFRGAEAANLYALRGYHRQTKDDLKGALADYGEAIARDPHLVMAFNNRGNIYRDIGDYDLAIADYDQALKLNPNKPDPLASRGWIYSQKGEVERAKDDFRKALALNPDPSLKVKLEEAMAVLEPKKDPAVISDPSVFSNPEGGMAAEVPAIPAGPASVVPAAPASPPSGQP